MSNYSIVWKEQLIQLYTDVCNAYDSRLAAIVQRLSPNNCPKFTDKEAMTLYLWGTKQQYVTAKAIYRYSKMHLSEWFPLLPSYQAFCKRLSYLAPAFEAYCAMQIDKAPAPESSYAVIDAMPIAIARAHRSGVAKTARSMCKKTYCASRDEWYYGVKLHMVSSLRHKTLPIPRVVIVTPANHQDLGTAKHIFDRGNIHGCTLLADKAYVDKRWKAHLLETYDVTLLHPRKRVSAIPEWSKGRDSLSQAICSARQPIEVFFNWLNEKTGIQRASKVRSVLGLRFHIFGKLAAALHSLFNP